MGLTLKKMIGQRAVLMQEYVCLYVWRVCMWVCIQEESSFIHPEFSNYPKYFFSKDDENVNLMNPLHLRRVYKRMLLEIIINE